MLLLDGVDDVVSMRSRERLNLSGANGFTLELWLLADPAQISEANPDAVATAQFNILEKGLGRGECPYALRYPSNGKLGFFRTDGQKTLMLISITQPPQPCRQSAIALRQAFKQKVGKPWRVLHRVTYVSRVLPRYGSPAATPAEDTLRAANIESNWELIKRLEPYVQAKTRSDGELADAIRDIISRFMPELANAESYIIEYMSRYYQVFPDSVLQGQVQ